MGVYGRLEALDGMFLMIIVFRNGPKSGGYGFKYSMAGAHAAAVTRSKMRNLAMAVVDRVTTDEDPLQCLLFIEVAL